jgi:YfiR/HmsC-like
MTCRTAHFLLASALVVSVRLPASQAADMDEYRLKAAYLYNFAKFVEWPADAFTTPASPIEICVAGDKPFAERLLQLVNGQTVNERAVVARALEKVEPPAGCQILFVSRLQGKKWQPILRQIAANPTLTVGEADSFLATGGLINFRVEDQHVRFEIDADGAARARLRISAKLLALQSARGGTK